MYSYTEAMGYPALLKLKVEELADEKSGQSVRRDYILQSIEEEPISESKRLSKAHQSNTGSSTISISDLYALVKGYDKDFKSQPSSKVVNADGTPKVVCLTKHWQKNQTVMCQCIIGIKIKPPDSSDRPGYNSPGL